jgi:anti-anti-sigma regulatory factor
MLRISTIETRFQRRLVLEGKLVEPWVGEFREVYRKAIATLAGRKLVIDLTDVTVIGCEAESVLSELMQQGAKFSCGGVLIKHVLKRLARRCRSAHGTVEPSGQIEPLKAANVGGESAASHADFHK